MSRLVSERKISNDVAVPITGYIYTHHISLSFAFIPDGGSSILYLQVR